MLIYYYMKNFLLLVIYTIFTSTNGCSLPGISNSVRIRENTYVCVTIGPLNWNIGNNTGVYLRTASTLVADDLSSIKIKDSWTSTDYNNDTLIQTLGVRAEYGQGLAVAVESMGQISFQKLYRSVDAVYGNTTVTYPVFMAIINVIQGEVKSIKWNDNCKWCAADRCVSNTYDYFGNVELNTRESCYVPDSECVYGYNTTTGVVIPAQLCELKVYITWTGTDADGYFFDSAASRFSRITNPEMEDYASRQLNTGAS